MKYCIEMYVGAKRLMLVSFHKTHLEASLKIAEYALEDRENGKSCYRYEIVKL